MRTTVTLEPDVERLVREEMHRRRQGFKETLNELLRRAVTQPPPICPAKPFKVTGPFAGRLLPEWEGMSACQIEAELEARDFIELTQRVVKGDMP